jgi:uncharacterized OB-fold protein
MPFNYFGKINFTPYTKVDKFAEYLQKGKLMGTKCKKCGEIYFPPRADCLKCMDDKFEWVEYSGNGTLNAPYTIGIVDLKEGGRLLAWIGDIPKDEIKNDMPVKVVPRIFEEIPEIKLYYTIEKP